MNRIVKRVGTQTYIFETDASGKLTIILKRTGKPVAQVLNGKIQRKRTAWTGYRDVSTTRDTRDDDLLDLWLWLIIWDEIITDGDYAGAYAAEVAASSYDADMIRAEMEAAEVHVVSSGDDTVYGAEATTFVPDPEPAPAEETRAGNYGGGGNDYSDGGDSDGGD